MIIVEDIKGCEIYDDNRHVTTKLSMDFPEVDS